MKDNHNVPFQVQTLIDSMLNSKDNVHLRGNYRFRLDSIRAAIESAIKKYDNEAFLSNSTKKKRA
jgi:hypothetical protein